jgi:O-acetyl-ADP-ribose deacetylase (regulator of RNase III)
MNYTSTKLLSALSCPQDKSLRDINFAPLGAAAWTTSGDLAQQGITAIAQAASGAMRSGQGFDPTRDSVSASIKNSLLLAAAQGYSRLAIPFIVSGIFKDRIDPGARKPEIAFIITQSIANSRGAVDVVIVAWDPSDKALFDQYVRDVNDPGITVQKGSITDFSCHHCPAIVNAANMEVRFGCGLSGHIAKAVNGGVDGGPKSGAIDQEAQGIITAFWQANPSP